MDFVDDILLPGPGSAKSHEDDRLELLFSQIITDLERMKLGTKSQPLTPSVSTRNLRIEYISLVSFTLLGRKNVGPVESIDGGTGKIIICFLQ